MIKEKVFFRNSLGQKMCGVICRPDGKGPFPVVVVCHGFSSNKESNNTKMMVPGLTADGIAVFAFDFSGHGESEGKLENVTVSQAIDDLKSALDYVDRNALFDSTMIGLFGSSFGGITAIFVAASDKRVKVLALKAPICDFKKYTSDTRENVAGWKERGFLIGKNRRGEETKLNYSYYADGIRYNAVDVAKKIRVPTLVVVGDNDVTVFTEKVKEFFDTLDCKKRLEIIKGADHWFDGKLEVVFGLTTGWFKSHLK